MRPGRRRGDLRSITKISDFYSARQWHATGMYNEYFGPVTRAFSQAAFVAQRDIAS